MTASSDARRLSCPTGALNGERPQPAATCQAACGIRCNTRETWSAERGRFQQNLALGSSHNPEVAGSNPAPATKEIPATAGISSGLATGPASARPLLTP